MSIKRYNDGSEYLKYTFYLLHTSYHFIIGRYKYGSLYISLVPYNKTCAMQFPSLPPATFISLSLISSTYQHLVRTNYVAPCPIYIYIHTYITFLSCGRGSRCPKRQKNLAKIGVDKKSSECGEMERQGRSENILLLRTRRTALSERSHA